MAKKSEKRYGTCQNPECMNYGMSEVIPDDGNCPVCHTPMKPEEESGGTDGFDLNDTDDFSIGGGMRKAGKSDGPNWKIIGIIASAILLAAAIGFAVWKFVFDTQEIAKIKLKPKSVTLVLGENPREVIKATVVDKKGKKIKDAKITFKWSVADDKIATVTQGGEVTAVKKGNTTITVKIEGMNKRAICKVDVKEPNDTANVSGGNGGKEDEAVYIKQLSIKGAKDFTLTPGATKTLDYTAVPEDNDEEPEWESSNPAVVTVDAEGLVKAVGEGSATITIKATNVSASVNVTVKKQRATNPPRTTGYVTNYNIGYGLYTGDVKNGKPHGHGTITYKTTRRVVSWLDHVAHPGDKFEGDFRDGVINGLGYLKTRDGNVIAIQ